MPSAVPTAAALEAPAQSQGSGDASDSSRVRSAHAQRRSFFPCLGTKRNVWGSARIILPIASKRGKVESIPDTAGAQLKGAPESRFRG